MYNFKKKGLLLEMEPTEGHLTTVYSINSLKEDLNVLSPVPSFLKEYNVSKWIRGAEFSSWRGMMMSFY